MTMKNFTKTGFMALAIAAASTPAALAQEENRDGDKGLYVNLINGVNFASGDAADYDTGYLGGLGVGYSYGYGLSGEIEVFYRTNDFDGLAGAAARGLAPDGTLASLTGFANAVYKFENVGSGTLRPYIGAGIGYVQEIDADLALLSGGEAEVSGSGFAWQVKAGVDVKLSKSWSLDLGARYMDVGTKRLDGNVDDIDFDQGNFGITLGIVKRF